MKISIIIPVVNEADNLHKLLPRLKGKKEVEVIVVDGGSTDDSLTVATQYADVVVESPSGRALQMNAGAKKAGGGSLWFIHADSALPAPLAEYLAAIKQHEWGRFDIKLSGKTVLLTIVEKMMNIRSALSSIATGDQGIFIRRELFETVGWFPSQALMEDIALSKRLKKITRMARIKQPLIITSSRKWEQEGVIKTMLLMWRLRLLYFFGADPDKLNHKYYRS